MMFGGIAGALYSNGTIQYCYNVGNIIYSGEDNSLSIAGGICGGLFSQNAEDGASTMLNCYNSANVTASGIFTGGILGSIGDYCSLSDCYISDTIEVIQNGVVATNIEGGNTSSSGFLGKFIGYFSDGAITNVTDNNILENMPTIYDVLNEFSESTSTIWDSTNPNQPKLLWEK